MFSPYFPSKISGRKIEAIGSEGNSLTGKSVRDFFITKGFIRSFDGFLLKTKGFCQRVYEIFRSEMHLGWISV